MLVAARATVAEDRAQAARCKRDIVRAFAGAPAIVAMDLTGAPETVRGTDGALLITFTDAEAATAYWTARHIDSAAVSSATLGGAAGTTAGSALAAVPDAQAREVLVNPAGPAGTVITAAELDAFRPRRPARMPKAAIHQWLDADARGRARAATAERLDELRAAIIAGDERTAQRIWDQPLELNPLGSLESAAAGEALKGLSSVGHGEIERGINQLTYAAVAYVRFGFPERCVDLLLEAARPLMTASLDPALSPAAGAQRVSAVVSLLEQMQVDWRRAERNAFITEFRRRVPDPAAC